MSNIDLTAENIYHNAALDLDATSREVSLQDQCDKVMREAFQLVERTSVMIDGPAIYETLRSLNCEAAYDRIPKLFKKYCRLQQLHYYIDIPSIEGHVPQIPLTQWLSYNSYNVNDDYIDAKIKYNCSASVRLVSDMLNLAHSKTVDHLVLFVNKGWYDYPIQQVVRMGLRVSVIGAAKKTNDTEFMQIHPKLRQVATQFIDIRDLLCEIKK